METTKQPLSLLGIQRIVAGYFWLEPDTTQGCSQLTVRRELVGCDEDQVAKAFGTTSAEVWIWFEMGLRLIG